MKTTKSFSYGPVLALAALLATVPVLRAADAPAGPPPEGRRERMQEAAERMADELDLTADQRAKWKESAQQEMAEVKPLRDDTSLSKEDRRAKMTAIHQKYRDQRAALLTPEQKAKFDKMSERMEKRRERMEEKRDKANEN